MKTNHRRGFVDPGWCARTIALSSRISGARALVEDKVSYDGHRGAARSRAGAKRMIRTRDRRALSRNQDR